MSDTPTADTSLTAQAEPGPGRGARLPLPTVLTRPGRLGARLGLAVVALGLVIIGIGWNGAAGAGGQINHVTDLRAQLPWLLSGGFLGLGVVVLGAALVVTESNRENRARLEAKLEELAGALAAGTAPAPADLTDLVAAGASSYHRPDCRLVQGRAGVEYLTRPEAEERGLRACRICSPARVSA